MPWHKRYCLHGLTFTFRANCETSLEDEGWLNSSGSSRINNAALILLDLNSSLLSFGLLSSSYQRSNYSESYFLFCKLRYNELLLHDGNDEYQSTLRKMIICQPHGKWWFIIVLEWNNVTLNIDWMWQSLVRMNQYEANYHQFVPVYIPQSLFCSVLAHVLQAHFILDVVVAYLHACI
jgi:hypothetical protein